MASEPSRTDRRAVSWSLSTALGLLVLLVLLGPQAVGARDVPPAADPASSAIAFYQRYISSLKHGHCRFLPSCSEYARQAIRRHGIVEGSALAMDRLMRCNGSAGRYYPRAANRKLYDPVADRAVTRLTPRLPGWLIPALSAEPPSLTGKASGECRNKFSAELAARISRVLTFAQSLADVHDCYRAGTEYFRAAHTADAAFPEGAPLWHAWAHRQTGDCYFRAGDWLQAERAFVQAAMLDTTSTSRRLAGYLAATCRFNRGEYWDCTRMLRALIPKATRDRGVQTRAEEKVYRAVRSDGASETYDEITSLAPVLLGACSMARGRWDEAHDAFLLGATRTRESVQAKRFDFLARCAERGSAVPQRSKGLAQALSTVLPGAGQLYAGRAQDGLRHLLFNAAIIYSIVKLVHSEHYPAAYLVTAVEIPFYLGNIFGAGKAARDYSHSRRLRYLTEVLDEAGHP